MPFAIWSLFCPYSLLRLSTVMALLLAQQLDFPRLLSRQHCSAAAKKRTTEERNTAAWLLIFKVLYPLQFFTSYLENVSTTSTKKKLFPLIKKVLKIWILYHATEIKVNRKWKEDRINKSETWKQFQKSTNRIPTCSIQGRGKYLTSHKISIF